MVFAVLKAETRVGEEEVEIAVAAVAVVSPLLFMFPILDTVAELLPEPT